MISTRGTIAASSKKKEGLSMSTEDENKVWSSTLDGRYTVKVARTAHYHGELTIADEQNVLYRQAVGLSYNSLFGPDVDDVATWQEIATKFVDNLQRPKTGRRANMGPAGSTSRRPRR
jgi:hypothetical protein